MVMENLGILVTREILAGLSSAAIERWASLGLSTSEIDKLRQTTLVLDDLTSNTLAQTQGYTIILDRDASGMGWYIDPTPLDRSEFTLIVSESQSIATADSPAFGHVDLLSAIAHEFGHILGLEHSQTDALMSSTLPIGKRLLPSLETLQGVRIDGVVSDRADLADTNVDLQADGVTATDNLGNSLTTVNFGQQFNINWNVSQIGDNNLTAGTWQDRLYLSRDRILSADDINIINQNQNRTLVVNGQYTYTASVNIPINVNDFVLESEPNDSILTALDLQQNFASISGENNYLVKAKGSISAAYEGDYYRINASPGDRLIINQTGFDTYLYLYDRQGNLLASDDDSGGDGAAYIDYQLPTNADAGDYYIRAAGYDDSTGNYDLTVQLQSIAPIITGNITSGDYYLLLQTDGSNRIVEGNEANNLIASTTPISLVPINIVASDLIVTSIIAPSQVTVGSNIDLTWTVLNQGNGDVLSNWNDRIYLSDDNIFDSNDTILATTANSSTLAANSSYTINQSIALPTQAIGSKYLIIRTNSDGTQFESDITNNYTFVPININIATSDLQADRVVTVDNLGNSLSSIYFGQQFKINWNVSQIGDNNLTGSTWQDRLYLSRDRILSNDDINIVNQNQNRTLANNGQYTDSALVTLDRYQPLPIDVNGFVVESEPNDSILTALDLNQNFLPTNEANTYLVKAKGSISTAAEGDYYRINASAGDRLIINQSGFDTYLYLYDRDGNLLRSDDDSGGNSASYINYQLPTNAYTGDYYVRAAGYGGRTGNYNLTIQLQSTAPIITNNITPGDYYLLLQTDGSDEIVEGNEANNIIASTTPISLTAYTPDLQANLVIATDNFGNSLTNAYIGRELNVTWNVSQIGSANITAGAWQDRLYLSRDRVLSDDDINIVNQSQNRTLASNGQYTDSALVTLDVYQPLPVDVNGFVVGIAANNSISTALNLHRNFLPTTAANTYLVKVKGAISTANERDYYRITGNPGDSLRISSDKHVELLNRQGNVVASNVGNGYYASPVLDYQVPSNAAADDYYIRVVSYGYPSNYDLNIQLQSTTPITTNNITPGDYYLLLKTDASNGILEGNETNNIIASTTPISLTAYNNIPDLTIVGFAPATPVDIQSIIPVSWTVTNALSADPARSGWFDYVYLSDDQTLDNNDIALTSVIRNIDRPNLGSGASYTVQADVSISVNVTGNKYLIFATDRTNSLLERDETNNQSIVPINIITPDLTVNSVVASTQVGVDRNIELTWKVLNQGNGSALSNWNDFVYLSDDNIFDDNDIILAAPYNINTLTANQSYATSQTITLPNEAVGNKYLIVRTNSNGTQIESDITNNLSIVPISIVTPDLTVTSVVTSTQAIFGSNIELTWTILNQGNGDALSNWTEFIYLSDDNVFDSNDIILATPANIGTLTTNHSYTNSRNITLPIQAIGNKYLIVRTNSNNTQIESDRTNNQSIVPINIVAPDLQADRVIAVDNLGNSLSNIDFRQQFKIDWDVSQIGLANITTGTWQDRIYLSRDRVLSGDDINIVNQTQNRTLATNGQYIDTASVNINYNSHLPIDANGFVSESEKNDSISTALNLQQNFVLTSEVDNYLVKAKGSISTPYEGDYYRISASPGDRLIINQTGLTYTNLNLYDSSNNLLRGSYYGNIDYQLPANSSGGDYYIYAGGYGSITGNYNLTVQLQSTAPITTEYITPGDYYLLLKTDGGNGILESNESNNIIASTTPIHFDTARPDLSIVGTVPTTPAYIQSTIPITWTVTNDVNADPARSGWSDYVYLSDDQILDNNDVVLTSALRNIDRPNLAAGEGYTSQANITLPVGVSGNKYLIFVTDRTNTRFEKDENNNQSVVPINIVAPDLAILTPPTIDRTTASPNQSVALTWQVTNTGNATTNRGWYDRVYLSTDTTVSEDDITINYFYNYPTVGLGAGQSYSRTENVTIPNLAGLGNRYLLVVADDYNNYYYNNHTSYQLESNESNNSNATAIPLTIEYPDLIITTATAPSQISSTSGTIDFSWTVINQGVGTALGNRYDYIYLSNDDKLDNGDTLLGGKNLSQQLTPNQSYTATQTIAIPSNITGGNKYLIFATNSSADYSGYVPESDLTNNIFVKAVSIVTPDLTISNATAPSTAVANETIQVNWDVANPTDVPALSGQWYDRVYLSVDNIWDSNDRDITPYSNSYNGKPLNARGTASNSANIALPSGTFGNFYLFVVTDASRRQSETDETNNISNAIPISITAPNLTIATTVPSIATLNQPFSVAWTVTNASDSKAVVAWNDLVYISNDTTLSSDDRLLTTYNRSNSTPLAGRQSYTVNQNLNLDNSSIGNKYLIFTTNKTTYLYGGNPQTETNYSDNSIVVPINVNAPDLKAESITNDRTTAEFDTSIDVNWTVSNLGEGKATGNWEDRIYLSKDRVLSNDDLKLGSQLQNITNLAPTNSYQANSSVLLTYDKPRPVDVAGYISEVEDNNTLATANDLRLNFLETGANKFKAKVRGISSNSEADYFRFDASPGDTVNLQMNNNYYYPAITLYDRNGNGLASGSSYYGSASTTYTFSASNYTGEYYVRPTNYYDYYSNYQLEVELQTTKLIQPKPPSAGEYYLILKADAKDGLLEGSDANSNTVASITPITITYAPRPDLTIAGTVSQTNINNASTLPISWTVTNQSTVDPAVANWNDYVYISNDNILDVSDRFLLSLPRPNAGSSLAAGASYTVNSAVALPADLIGNKFLLFATDRNNNILETNEINNISAVPISIGFADLKAVSAAVTVPSTIAVGGQLSIDWTVLNQGDADASSNWEDSIYLSNDDNFDASDLLLGTKLNSNILSVNNSYTTSRSITLPTQAIGNKYLIVRANSNSGQHESDRNNNYTFVPINIQVPDLTISNLIAPTIDKVGAKITVNWQVNNTSPIDAAIGWNDRVYLSKDNVLDNNDILLTSKSQAHLTGGGNYTSSAELTIPNLSSGNYYLIATTDRDLQQLETDETNNTTFVPIQITLPNLTVTEVIIPPLSISGETATVSWTVKNQGDAATSTPWTDALYWSNDDTIGNADDVYIGSYQYTGNLAPNQSITRTQDIAIAPDASGKWRLVVRTDAGNQIYEDIAETDNWAISNIGKVQQSAYPNLKVSSVQAPSTAFSGQQTTVTWTVTNDGEGATSTPYWIDRVWISANDTLDDLDTYLGEVANPTFLNPGESYTSTLPIAIPNAIGGNFKFLVKTDYNDRVYELHRDNDNVGVSNSSQIELTPPPDVQPLNVNAPTQAFSGQEMALSWTVINNGPGSIRAGQRWRDAIYMSSDNVLDANDRLLDNYIYTPTVDDGWTLGESYQATKNITLPIGVSGDFYFFVKTDSDRQLQELAFNANNIGFDATPTTVRLTPPPDLEMAVTAPATGTAGRSIQINYQVTNNGATITPNTSWSNAFYLSTDSQFDGSDILLGVQRSYGALDAGASNNKTLLATLPNGLEGTYYILGAADSSNEVFELDNANNGGSRGITIISKPADLVARFDSLPTVIVAGSAAQFNWTVTNTGIGDTIGSNWTDELWLSTDATWSGDDIYLSGFGHNGVLDVNQSYSQNRLVTVPLTVAAGNYHLILKTDRNDSIYESNNTGSSETNNQVVTPVTVLRNTADLQIAQVNSPTTAISGQTISVSWTGKNLGTARTNSDYWYDGVYLSADNKIDSSDRLIGRVFHSGAMDVLGEYQSSLTATLPIDFTGTYYAIVRTDENSDVVEGNKENNNVTTATNPVVIQQGPTPNLIVSNISAPVTAISGQQLSIDWTVKNIGTDTANNNWYDAIYLSRDRILDKATDIYVGFGQHNNPLAAGDSDRVSQSVKVPPGLSGPFYVFVVGDSGNKVFELNNEGDNIGLTNNLTVVSLPAPADLSVGTITIPSNATPGQNITVDYSISNNGPNTAKGNWFDNLYLSTDNTWDANDTYLGTAFHNGDVAAGGSYQNTLTTQLPGVTSGDYKVIVRTDIRNAIVESTEANNIGASLNKVAIDVPALLLDGATVSGILRQGEAVYYKVEVPAGETVQLVLDSTSGTAVNELYISYGQMPNRSKFDYGFSELTPDQKVVVPLTQAGTYYVMARGQYVPDLLPNSNSLGADYQIKAEKVDFSISSIGQKVGDRSGKSTFEIKGAKFSDRLQAFLDDGQGHRIAASEIRFEDTTRVYATFDLQNAPIGNYNLHLSQKDISLADVDLDKLTLEELATTSLIVETNRSTALTNAFEVIESKSDNILYSFDAPSAVRAGSSFDVVISYANRGTHDVAAPIFAVDTGVPTTIQISSIDDPTVYNGSVPLLGVSHHGDPTILKAGEVGTIRLRMNAGGFAGSTPINFRTLSPQTEKSLPIDYAELGRIWGGEGVKNNPVWDETVTKLQGELGLTWGDYHQALLERIRGTHSLDVPSSSVRLLTNDIIDEAYLAAAVGEAQAPAQPQPILLPQSLVVPQVNLSTEAGLASKLIPPQGFDRDNDLAKKESLLYLGAAGAFGFGKTGLAAQFLLDFIGLPGQETMQSYKITDTPAYTLTDLWPLSLGDTIRTWDSHNSYKTISSMIKADIQLNIFAHSIKNGIRDFPDLLDYRYYYVAKNDNDIIESTDITDPNDHTKKLKLVFESSSQLVTKAKYFDTKHTFAYAQAVGNLSLYPRHEAYPQDANGEDIVPDNKLRNAALLVQGLQFDLRTAFAGMQYTEINLKDIEIVQTDCDTFKYIAKVQYLWKDLYEFDEGDGEKDNWNKWARELQLAGWAQPFVTAIQLEDTISGEINIPPTDPCNDPPPPNNPFNLPSLFNPIINFFTSHDPNDILGPSGFGEQHWITADNKPLDYTIRFENDPKLATANANIVRITQTLDDDLDVRSFRVGSFGFGDVNIDVPDNRAFYQTRLDLRSTKGIYLDVLAGIDIATREAYWEFTSIDPNTGVEPLNPALGFLPPNLKDGEGQAFVTYSVKPKANIADGAVIDAQARIIFDTNEPIDTPAIFNTIDLVKPTSSINALPTNIDTPTFNVSWAGSDNTNGSALANYTILVAKDGGTATPWLTDTTLTDATYSGESGHIYAFSSIAKDNAGNVQTTTTPVQITVGTPPTGGAGVISFSDSAISVNESNSSAVVTLVRADGSYGNTVVAVNFTDGTATGGSQPFNTGTDYANAQILVAFNAGETTKTFAIPLNLDYLIEGNETLQLSLANPTNGVTLGSTNTSIVTIVDDDTSIGFTNSAYRLNEDGTGSNVITIQRSGNLNLSTSVNFNVTGGSAINGEDYNLAANTLVTFAVGEATKTITIPVVNDTQIEGLETIKFSLSNSTNGATIDSNRQNTVGIITDDETALKFNFNVAVGTDERAVDGFIGAANIWSKLLDNPVVINADLGFSNIGTSTLAQNTAERLTVSYESFRTALAAHRFSLDDYLATGNLSKTNSFDLLINRTTNSPNGVGSIVPYLDNDGDANNRTISINRANAKALGLVNATDIGRDTQLILNSYGGLSWDFDSNDGIATNAYDFVGLATHELGHALGFDSGIDTLDNGVPKSDEANTFVTPLDLFRFSTQSVAAGKGTIDWTATNTDKYFSIDGGITPIASFATGVIHGDGKEPQHWKDNLGLGILDPTLVRGEQLAIKPLDKQAFDVIGWNLLGTTPAVATIEFTANSFQINEDGTSVAAVTLTRSGRTLGTATVNIDLTAGTATAGIDYNSQSFAVTFADGEVTKTVSIPVIDDTLIEPSETLTLSLSSNEVATVLGTQSTALLTVFDNDVQLAFERATYTVNEDGTSTIAIKVLRTGKITGEVGTTIVLTNGTASDADYINTSINVVFAAGEVEKVVTVPIINDTLIETDETINLSLTNPTNGATLGTQSTAVLTVIDNDSQLAFERATYTVNEDGTNAIAIKVLRTGKTTGEVGATIVLSNGTASNTDYINTPINVVFAAGEVEKIVTVPIVNDTLIEADETINLSLTSPTNGATLGIQSTAVLTVVDNDVQLAFERANYTVNEDGSSAIVIKVLRTGKTDTPVGATVALTNGTAGNADYTNTPINVVFAAGEVEKIVTIPIINDTLVETDETIDLSLTNPTNGGTLGTQSTAVLTIVDNDTQLAFDRANYTVNEDGTSAIAIKVLRTGKTTGITEATIALSNGTAGNSDYTNTPTNVVFAAGEIEKIVTVPIINDTIFEPDETVNLRLTNPTNGATIGTQSTTVLTLVSDDIQGLNLIGDRLNNTLNGGAGNDFIDGREGNDTLNGYGGDDTLIGGAGNDILDGGTGADNMAGGIGNDIYYVDNIGDIVTEELNSGTDTVNASINYTLTANVENLNLLSTTISGTGNELNNTITGNDGDNIIDGKGGNDRLVGGKGNDTYYVDSTSDTLVEAVDAGIDTVIANLDFSLRNIANVENLTLISTATTATGNTLGNTLTGNELDNSLYGREGDDILVGGDGNDLLDGGTGADNLTGGSGNDTYSVDNLGDVVSKLLMVASILSIPLLAIV
jgi:CARDB/Calx-beta domain/Bacterial pre-peptidase C-terminal domain/RTX calcium-binding nonapeptide repeat (4 copies)